jgi:hypothetical protein
MSNRHRYVHKHRPRDPIHDLQKIAIKYGREYIVVQLCELITRDSADDC